MKIVFIGAGNLATGLSLEMQRVGMTIGQVYSYTGESAESLARKLNCPWTCELDEVITDADLYMFAVRDSVLPDVISRIKSNEGLWVHTSGSIPVDIFEGYAGRYGVFYPLQSFTKKRRLKLEKTPIFLEVNNKDDMKMLKNVAIALSGDAREVDSKKRLHIHLAAVFACNFTNHMYVIATKILEEQGLSHHILLPLIGETADKVSELLPVEAQTGPAVRFDKPVIDKHIAMIEDPALQSIYNMISQNIYNSKMKNE